MYIVFIVGVVIIFYQIFNLKKIHNIKAEASKIFGVYKHNSHIGGFYMSMISNIVVYLVPIYQKKFMYAFWLSPLLVIFILKWYRNSQKIELFDTGIQVFGDFVEWKKIIKLELNNDEISFVTNDKDPLYYTITKLKESNDCFIKMKERTPHINCA